MPQVVEHNRQACRAGMFYPRTKAECIAELAKYIPEQIPDLTMPDLIAGIVPHAGWFYSGATAGKVYRALQQKSKPKTIVLFGAVHTADVDQASIWPKGKWQTPLGEIEVDADLAEKILALDSNLLESNERGHLYEHSLEVQVPFIQYLFPNTKIVPILVEPCSAASKIGEAVAQVAKPPDVIAIASSDMTHYGERFGFTPAGMGKKALDWVKEKNDRSLIELMQKLAADQIVEEACKHHNACGSGAIAAVLSFAKAHHRTQAHLLAYTTSWDVDPERTIESFVGYAGLVC